MAKRKIVNTEMEHQRRVASIADKVYAQLKREEVTFEELGQSGECWVKDLWTQKCEGKHSGFYVTTVPAHATKLFKMRPVDCPKCD